MAFSLTRVPQVGHSLELEVDSGVISFLLEHSNEEKLYQIFLGFYDSALAQKESYFVKERWLNKNVTLKQILVICEGANDESTEQERTD